ncbi:hypothetical protein KFE25_005312 [Diacronema lutheri]|uniref:EF-hand domain-containing protein n=1 Tax=Diacronema lutheri TaxID=2081491 RepID=A0A8J6C8U9_DIALT|nr:hypothetical protein KFE25_005312 [Diacronema lutheri]
MSRVAPALTDHEVEELCVCTPLRPRDIAAIHAKFHALAPDSDGRVSCSRLERMRELAANPLASRLCAVFSSRGDGSLDFIEFVDLFGCMAKAAPLDIKLSVAFRVYDFDGDGFIGRSDVEDVIELVAGVPGDHSGALLSRDEASAIVSRVLAEGDFDGNEKISPTEFTKLLRRVEDFGRTFVMSVTHD